MPEVDAVGIEADPGYKAVRDRPRFAWLVVIEQKQESDASRIRADASEGAKPPTIGWSDAEIE